MVLCAGKFSSSGGQNMFLTCVCIVLDNLLLSDYDIATSSAEFGFEYMCSVKDYLLWGHLRLFGVAEMMI